MLIAAFAGDSAMWITEGATVTLVGCSFIDSIIHSPLPFSAVLSVCAVNVEYHDAQLQDTIVRLEQCTFSGNDADNVLATYKGNVNFAAYSAIIFSDTITHKVLQVTVDDDDAINRTEAPARPLSTAPAGREGITSTSPWLHSVQQVCS
jgi:hypothetical protein